MSRSYSETTTIKCPGCRQKMSVEIWRIVDTQERPDLLDRIRKKEIHAVVCGNCGHKGRINAPLLINVPEREELFFVRAEKTSEKENRNTRDLLVKKLAASFEELPEYLDTVEILHRDELPEVFRKSDERPVQKRVSSSGENGGSGASESEMMQLLAELSQEEHELLAEMMQRISSPEEFMLALDQHPKLRLAIERLAGDSEGDADIAEELHPILSEIEQLTQISDMPQRVKLYRQALLLADRRQNPELWAALSGELGDSLQQNPLGERADNIEEAIRCYGQALEVMTRDAMPVDWAQTMNNLALAYSNRIREDRADNIEEAIGCYGQALEVRTRDAMPIDWAQTMNNLAAAYKNRIRGERADNIEEAIRCCGQALEVMTRDAMPVEWATAMMNLAAAYRNRIREDRAENIEEAIRGCGQALEVMTRDAMPVEWAEATMNLASAYIKRIRGDRADNIEEAIRCCGQALEVTTRDAMPVEWATAMMNLAAAYYSRIRGDRADNIEEAIGCYGQALEVMTRDTMPVEWATAMINLATAYKNRIRGDRAENIEEAIRGYGQALEVMTRDAMPVEWATAKMNLATAYRNRIREDRADNIEEAIRCCGQALEVMTRDTMPVDWATAMMNLAIAYSDRIREDRADNIEEAIRCCGQALEVMTRDAMPVEWATAMINLATAYSNRIRSDRAENIEEAIRCYGQALEVMTRDAMPIDWATAMMNLATAYINRIRGDRADNIEEAIGCCGQALEVRTRDAMPVEWATAKMNLANAYRNRIREDRADNIEEAIRCCGQALEVMTRDDMPVEWATAMMNLANAYSDHIRGDRAENIEEAIECCGQALEVMTRDAMPVDWATAMMNLANAYRNRIRGERADNIEEAIRCYGQALEVRTRDAMPVEWATAMMNLAAAYKNRIRGDRAENIEKAIRGCGQALEVRTRDSMPVEWAQTMNNLAAAYYSRIREDRADNIEEAIRCYGQALEVRTRDAMPFEWGETMNNLGGAYSSCIRGDRAKNIKKAIECYKQALEVRTRDTMPLEHQKTQHNLGNLCMNKHRWTEAEKAFTGLLAANEILYKAAALPESRQSELREVRGMAARMAYTLIKSKMPEPMPGDMEKAVEVLEQNRARWLSEALSMKSGKPETVPKAVWNDFDNRRKAYNELLNESRVPEDTPSRRTFLELGAAMRKTSKELDAALEKVREHAPEFMPAPNFSQIRAAVSSPSEALIYFAVTPVGSVAFIVGSHDEPVTPVWLDDLKEDKLFEELRGSADDSQLGGYLGAYDRWRANSASSEARTAWFSTLDSVTNWLWDSLMGLLTEKLLESGISHAVLIPQGWLGLLPLHAAWTGGNGKSRRYALDDVCYSYAPNALSLSASRKIREQSSAERILAIDEPCPVKAGSLPNSNAEVTAACEHFAYKKVLRKKSATRSAVRNALPDNDVFHFSCHGMADFAEPLNSGLLMANNEFLTLRDFLSIELKGARLAVLSACETGIPDLKNADEVISLPAGLVQAGVTGVVASLWSVSDSSTMMIMVRFYEFWRGDGLKPAEALRQAQIWVRDTTNGEKTDYFKGFLPEFDNPRMPVQLADMLYKASLSVRLDENDFEHPFYWAAFGYTGI